MDWGIFGGWVENPSSLMGGNITGIILHKKFNKRSWRWMVLLRWIMRTVPGAELVKCSALFIILAYVHLQSPPFRLSGGKKEV
jgi:hypothetical protein